MKMVIGCEWLKWLEEDEEGNLTILKEQTPSEIRKEYERLLQLEQESIKKNRLKSTIF